MDSLDVEVTKKEIISKVDRLGDDYTTFSYANKLIVNHSVEKNLSCRILIYDDYFNFSIQFYDNISYIYRYLLRMENISYDRLDSLLTRFVEVCNTSSKFVTNIYNYIDSLPSTDVTDVEESTVSEQFKEHFSKYNSVQYNRVLIGRYIGMIIVRDGSNLTVAINDGTEKVIFCKPVNQTNYVEVFKVVKSEEDLIKVLKKIILTTNDLRDTVWCLEEGLKDS